MLLPDFLRLTYSRAKVVATRSARADVGQRPNPATSCLLDGDTERPFGNMLPPFTFGARTAAVADTENGCFTMANRPAVDVHRVASRGAGGPTTYRDKPQVN